MHKTLLAPIIFLFLAINILSVEPSQGFGIGPGVDCNQTDPPLTPREQCLCDAYSHFSWKDIGVQSAIWGAGGAIAGARGGWVAAGLGALGGAGAGAASTFYSEYRTLQQQYGNCPPE